jgi:uncharacterized DUF497 family protein
VEFEWDEAKNRANRRKHGISFEEAQLIFDGLVLTQFDERVDYGELREITLGMLAGMLVISVVHTDRYAATRIISARFATPMEREVYYEYLSKAT